MAAAVSQIIDKYRALASKEVVRAVEFAAEKTGVDFGFLMEKAAAESGFNPAARAKTSSAAGLFQFIESTWLRMVKEYGPKYGLGQLAAQISLRDGKPCVDDCAARAAILSLRENPGIAALMAGEFSAANRQHLEARTKGPVGATELYLAHFMGPSGASKFLNARAQDGSLDAAAAFPKEAAANRGVFFDPATGRARTLDQVYDFFAAKFGGAQLAEAKKPAAAPAATAELPPKIASVMPKMPLPPVIIDDSFALLQSLPLSRLSADAILLLAQVHRRDEDPFSFS